LRKDFDVRQALLHMDKIKREYRWTLGDEAKNDGVA
jgi:hypothetical protein